LDVRLVFISRSVDVCQQERRNRQTGGRNARKICK
jgi:hypothetical protein